MLKYKLENGLYFLGDKNMRPSSYTQETMVIEKPSKSLVVFMNNLRDRKKAQLKELKEKKDFYFPKSK